MKKTILITWLGLLLTATMLTGCGGGGSGSDSSNDGGGTPPASSNSSNWDTLVWDQDNWS